MQLLLLARATIVVALCCLTTARPLCPSYGEIEECISQHSSFCGNIEPSKRSEKPAPHSTPVNEPKDMKRAINAQHNVLIRTPPDCDAHERNLLDTITEDESFDDDDYFVDPLSYIIHAWEAADMTPADIKYGGAGDEEAKEEENLSRMFMDNPRLALGCRAEETKKIEAITKDEDFSDLPEERSVDERQKQHDSLIDAAVSCKTKQDWQDPEGRCHDWVIEEAMFNSKGELGI